ncbi:MAG: Gfo/Idh/MocA family protein [Gemmatimonadales bacterium]
MSEKNPTRRDFVETAAKTALAAAFVPSGFPMIVPRHVLGGPGFQAPSDTLNVAIVGFGGMGSGNAEVLAQAENLVAICDVDLTFSETNVADKEKQKNRDGSPRPDGPKLRQQFDRAAKYRDFREMLDKQKDIDAVLVATPDHNHAVVAKAAMQLGKHVYVQKPLTTTVHEARTLAQLARDNPKIVTQMGNQGHSMEGTRSIVEWIQAGIIGPVREVHVWTNRPIWPQGVPRPLAPSQQVPAGSSFGNGWNMRSINNAAAAAMSAGGAPMPEGMRWDLYLGGTAEDVPWHPIYHPFNWRGWTDFGVGALGDMGAHLIDQPYWALGLTQPLSVEATSTPWGTTPIPPAQPGGRMGSKPVCYPQAMLVHYEFGARGKQPPVKLSWYDGGLQPPRPDLLPDNVDMLREGGVIFIGDKGILLHETYGNNPRIWPDALMEKAKAVPKTLPRIAVSHEFNWVAACKGQGVASSPFEYAAGLTETMLLGIVALRAGQGKKILYDAAASNVTNVATVNQYLTREYRSGWAV